MGRWPRPTYSAKKLKISPKLIIFILIALILFLAIQTFFLIETNLKPTILSIAQARAKVLATEAINQAINENIAQQSRYDHLIFTEKDNQGNIVLAEVNNMELARIQSLTTLSVQQALKSLQQETIKIPLGQVLGSDLLANYGPRIPVRLFPIGTVSAEMSQSFKASGINIVSHQVGMDITANVEIVIPFISADMSVDTFVPVVTATYFGQVPDTVINIPMPSNFEFPSLPELPEEP